jgi:hypothetical protein
MSERLIISSRDRFLTKGRHISGGGGGGGGSPIEATLPVSSCDKMKGGGLGKSSILDAEMLGAVAIKCLNRLDKFEFIKSGVVGRARLAPSKSISSWRLW